MIDKTVKNLLYCNNGSAAGYVLILADVILSRQHNPEIGADRLLYRYSTDCLVMWYLTVLSTQCYITSAINSTTLIIFVRHSMAATKLNQWRKGMSAM